MIKIKQRGLDFEPLEHHNKSRGRERSAMERPPSSDSSQLKIRGRYKLGGARTMKDP